MRIPFVVPLDAHPFHVDLLRGCILKIGNHGGDTGVRRPKVDAEIHLAGSHFRPSSVVTATDMDPRNVPIGG